MPLITQGNERSIRETWENLGLGRETQPGIEWHFQPYLHKPYKLRKSRILVYLSVTWLIFHPVASRLCLPCCFSFIEQPRKILYTSKIFVFETLKIGNCIRWHQNASVLNASPFRCDYRVIINLARLSSRCWPHTCDVVFPYSALLLRGPFVASVKKTTSETVNDPFVFWNSQQRSEGNILVAFMSSRESKRSILNRNKAQYRVQDLWKNYSAVRWNRWRLFRLIWVDGSSVITPRNPFIPNFDVTSRRVLRA